MWQKTRRQKSSGRIKPDRKKQDLTKTFGGQVVEVGEVVEVTAIAWKWWQTVEQIVPDGSSVCQTLSSL